MTLPTMPNRGFTIIESLIVLGILAVLTIVLIALWKNTPEPPQSTGSTLPATRTAPVLAT